MKGDFTRGHRPDGKRGRRYTRGLLQQRRLLLDSDVNSMTDALHERLRDLACDLGCPKGSPDLGFLVTPGLLLAVFEELDGVVVAENNVTVYRDYSRKFLDRFPSVFITADQGGPGSATLRMLRPADGDVRFWVRSDAATQVDLPGGVGLNVPPGDPFVAVDVNLAGPLDEIQINLDAGEQIWIGLIEEEQAAGTVPQFAVNDGRFYLAGLPLTLDEAGLYFDVTFPLDPTAMLVGPPPPALAAGDRIAAFLEGWERHITAVEDPGLLEQAVGGNLDTTTRGQAVGQVKLVRIPAGPLDTAVLSRAIGEPVAATGTLEVTTPAAPPDPDPCALPVEDGYTGPDNRFYQFNVHNGGPLGTALFKWSRDNGSELFATIDAPADNRLVFPSNTALRAGDLVEVLNEAVDWGDRAPAVMLAADQFQRPERAAGPLAILEQAAGPPPANGVAFVLRNISGVGDVHLDLAIFGPFPGGSPIKVRRWHGFIETVAGTNEYEIEHGIVIELNGEFSAGDYWQYEARVAGDNDNGPPVLTPHGPLRAFAPLALLQFNGAAQPLELTEWLDDRFSPICEMNADDLPFDGERVGHEDCDTVQEALECLFEREAGGCCEFTLDPDGNDTAQRIRDILDESEGEVTICFDPGVYPFTSTLEIEGRKVVLKGCPRAVLQASENARPMIHLHDDARLRLEELIVFAAGPEEIEVFIELDQEAGGVAAHAVGFINGGAAVPATLTAIRVEGLIPQPIDPNNPAPIETIQPDDADWPEVDLTECVFLGHWIVSAPQLSALRIRDTVCYCLTGGVSVRVVGALDMHDVGIAVAADFGAAAQWTAEELLTRSDTLLDQLPAILDVTPNDPATAALRIGLVTGGHVEGCLFVAGFGAVFTETRVLRLERNVYVVIISGVVIGTARGTLIHGEHGRSSNADGTGIDIILRALPLTGERVAGSGLTISDSIMDGFNVGISLASSFNLQLSHELVGVRVSENQISAVETGIEVGPGNNGFYPGSLIDVTIADNEIRNSTNGIVANGRVTPPPNSPVGYAEVRIESNWISASLGVGTIGSRFEISDNRIRLMPSLEQTAGIRTIDGVDTVIESNLIESEGPNHQTSVAIFVVRGSGARVDGNVSRCNQPLTGLRVESHAGLRADGNDFGPGNNELNSVNDVVCRNNRTQGRLTIRETESGQVIGNRLGSFGGDEFPGTLQVVSAQGLWQVTSNKADFGIDILPSFIDNLVYTPGNFTTIGISRPITFFEFEAMRDITFRSGNETFGNEFRAFAERNGGANFMLINNRPEAVLAVEDANWAEGWVSGIRRFVGGAVTDAAAAFDNTLVAAAAVITQERPYQALVAGNFSGTLQVGLGGNATVGSDETVVQVVANRAQFLLFVRDYRRRVVSNNASDFYSGIAIATQAAAIQGPNLDT